MQAHTFKQRAGLRFGALGTVKLNKQLLGLQMVDLTVATQHQNALIDVHCRDLALTRITQHDFPLALDIDDDNERVLRRESLIGKLRHILLILLTLLQSVDNE